MKSRRIFIIKVANVQQPWARYIEGDKIPTKIGSCWVEIEIGMAIPTFGQIGIGMAIPTYTITKATRYKLRPISTLPILALSQGESGYPRLFPILGSKVGESWDWPRFFSRLFKDIGQKSRDKLG